MDVHDEVSPRRRSARRLAVLGGLVAAVAALCTAVTVTALAAATPGGGWSRPRLLSAPRRLAAITALDCAAPSGCSAVGIYQDRLGAFRLYAVTERRGVWGAARAIAIPASLRKDDANAPVLSCASAGNCAAGGGMIADVERAFVVSQANGSWGTAQPVRGAGLGSRIFAISCPVAGQCTAAGGYTAFLVRQKHGSWGRAFPVPGLAALGKGHETEVTAISCPSPGNCSAGGTYTTSGIATAAFVVTEKHGTWGSAQPVFPRVRGLSILGALSCSAAGNCVAGGLSDRIGAFLVTEKNGTWGTAQAVPGTSGLREAGISQVSCPAPGQCSASGVFNVAPAKVRSFVATEKNGTWHAQILAGTGTDIRSLSCAAPGTCVAAGGAVVRVAGTRKTEAELALELNGRWEPARLLPGVLALDHNSFSQISEVSCPAPSRCTAIGDFFGNSAFGYFVTAQR